MFSFANEDSTFNSILTELRALGYRNGLLQEDYIFGDWFGQTVAKRRIDAAAFGQTPASYESACFGVIKSPNEDLVVSQYRALGAPIIFEVKSDRVRQWVVGRKDTQIPQPIEFSAPEVGDHFVKNAADWTPRRFLRAKNIGDFQWNPQLELFGGVIPEHEERIQSKLDPMLRSALAAASEAFRETAGKEPEPEQLFRLVFTLLTGKVFYDRKVEGFRNITATDGANALIAAVSRHYRRELRRDRVLNQQARNAAFEIIWNHITFLNLSVEVLAQIWSKTLVSEEVKKKLGIHRTSRSIVKYIVERIPFDEVCDEHQTVVEPCCGSGAFLIGAMNELRATLWGHSPEDRHAFFSKHLIGFEKDPFGTEISQLSLTLADFPNPEGWQIMPIDVFDKTTNREFLQALSSAGVVLCNPPFEDFDEHERIRYRPTSVKKPVELLHLILEHLHPHGVIGFVLPRNILDGQGYGSIRKRLVETFASIEVTSLPDAAFEADHEVVLLVATNALPHHKTHLTHRKVNDSQTDWQRFAWFHEVSSEESLAVSTDSVERTLAIPDLKPVWDHLLVCDRLSEWAHLHRGIEWNLPLTKDGQETGNREKLIRKSRAKGFMLGVPPQSSYDCFEIPQLQYLDMRKEHRRGNAHDREWGKPKVILNKNTRSRGHWRISAFADHRGLACYQTYIAVWPKGDQSIDVIAAILNGPVANAYVSTREGKTDITLETLKHIPVPYVKEGDVGRISEAVEHYLSFVGQFEEAVLISDVQRTKAELLLKHIDAAVLDAYGLPARLERHLLDWFNGMNRPVPFEFSDYFPEDFGPCFSLSDWLAGNPSRATVEHFREESDAVPNNIREILAYRCEQ